MYDIKTIEQKKSSHIYLIILPSLIYSHIATVRAVHIIGIEGELHTLRPMTCLLA